MARLKPCPFRGGRGFGWGGVGWVEEGELACGAVERTHRGEAAMNGESHASASGPLALNHK